MADVKWIKILTDIFDDEKIQLIEAMPEADTIIVIWFKILCLGGKSNNSGFLVLNEKIAYTDEMLCSLFRRPLTTIRMALSVLESFGMIEIHNNTYLISNWEKHQNGNKLEEIKEKTRLRVAKYRENLKLNECNVTVTEDVTQKSVTVTQQSKSKSKSKSIEKDIELDLDITNIGDKSPTKKFVIPNIDEIQNYILEKNYSINAETFFNFYESKNWYIGKNKMTNWKSALHTWQTKENQGKQFSNTQSNNHFLDMLKERECNNDL